jgi:hypothetical protein
MAVKEKALQATEANTSASAWNSTNVTIQLCKGGTDLLWADVHSATATIYDLEDDHACPRALYFECKTLTDVVSCTFPVLSTRLLRIDAEATEKSGTRLGFMPAITLLNCGGDATVQMMGYAEPVKQEIQRATTVALKPRWCENKGVRRDRMPVPEIASATAQIIPPALALLKGKGEDRTKGQPASHLLHAHVHNGTAYLPLQKGVAYEVDFQLKGKYHHCCHTRPFQLTVNSEGDQEIPILFEPCERVVVLFFVDPCGQPASPQDVHLEGTGQLLSRNESGGYALTGPEVGRVRFLSRDYDLSPNEIHIDERMAQAHMIQIAPRETKGNALAVSEPEDFVFEFDKTTVGNLSVEVFMPGGRFVATLTPDHKGQFVHPAKANDEFDFVARVDGRVVERIRMVSSLKS